MATDVTLSQPYTLDPRTVTAYRLRTTQLHHYPERFVIASIDLLNAQGDTVEHRHVRIDRAQAVTWVEAREPSVHTEIQTKLGITPA